VTRGSAVTIVPLAILVTTCSHEVRGPRIDAEPRLVSITIVPTERTTGHSATLVDPAALQLAVDLLSAEGWEENNDELRPTHRIQLLREDGSTVTYWLGTLSDPPRFPCFGFCSGFWAAASAPSGTLRPEARKILATSEQMFAVGRLLEPCDGSPQPDARVNAPVRPESESR
jgi:hypothetical protein